MCLRRFLSLIFIFSTASSLSQAKVIPLSEAVKLALKNSPELESAKSGEREAKALYRQYAGELFPTLDLNASGSRQKDSTTFSGLSQQAQTTDREIYQAYIGLEQPLYSGGAVTAGLRLGKLNEENARQTYFLTKQTRVSELVKLYYDLAERLSIQKATANNRKVLESYLAITKRYERIGRARRMDRLQAEANFNLSELDLEMADNNLYAAEISLKAVLGIEHKEPVELQDRFEVQPITSLEFEDAVTQAMRNLPEYKIKKLAIDLLKANQDLDFSTDMPSLSIQGRVGYSAADRDRLFDDTSEYTQIGLYLTAPLFSGLSSLSKLKTHREKLFQAEKDLALYERNLRSVLRDRLNRVKKLYELVVVIKNAAKMSEAALLEANAGYDRGTASSQDVISFQRSRFEAQQKEVAAQFNYLRGLLELRQILGIDLEKTYGD